MAEHVLDANGNGSVASRALAIMQELHEKKKLAYLDIPPEVYHATQAFSQSQLKHMEKSPSKFKWEIEHPTPPSAAQELGTAIHMAILEHDRFMSTYVEAPKFDRRTKIGKEQAAAFEAQHAGKRFLDPVDFAIVNAIHQRITTKSFFEQFFSQGQPEASFFVIDEATKLPLRGRVDNIIPDKNVIIDLKTTDCAKKEVFMKDITNYRYFVQAAFYVNLVEQATGVRPDFLIVAVEKSKDFDSNVFYIEDRAMKRGIEMCQEWLYKLSHCIRTDEWPGYENDFIGYDLPDWLAGRE